MNSEHSHSIWHLECQIHYQGENTTRYVRNGGITPLIVHYYISIIVFQITCFENFSSWWGMKRRIVAHSIYQRSAHRICTRFRKRIPTHMGVVCGIIVREVSIGVIEKTLAKVEVEGCLVEEDEDRLSIITAINLDT
jgi:hypothetical protein